MEQTFANPSAPPPPASKVSSPSLASQEPGLNVHYQIFCTLNQKYPLFKTFFKKNKIVIIYYMPDPIGALVHPSSRLIFTTTHLS